MMACRACNDMAEQLAAFMRDAEYRRELRRRDRKQLIDDYEARLARLTAAIGYRDARLVKRARRRLALIHKAAGMSVRFKKYLETERGRRERQR